MCALYAIVYLLVGICKYGLTTNVTTTSLISITDEMTSTELVFTEASVNNTKDGGSLLATVDPYDMDYSQGTRSVTSADCVFTNFSVETIVMGSIICFGVFGNTVSFFVLLKQMKTSPSLLILAILSVGDCIILIVILFTKTIRSFAKYTRLFPAYLDFYPYVSSYAWQVSSTAVQFTSHLTLLISIHRYVAVCKPFNAVKFSTKRIIIPQVIFIILFAISFNIPRFFERQVFVEYSENGTFIQCWYENTDLSNNEYYLWIYRTVFYYIIGYAIPLPILMWTTVKMITTMKQARESRKLMSTNQCDGAQDDVTPGLLVILLVYFIYQSAYVTRRVVHSIYPDDRRCGSVYYYAQIASSLGLVVNSSINFVIYMTMCKSFRQTLRSLCGRGNAIERYNVNNANV